MLLDALQAIELGQGRERHEHWGPRTLDLDYSAVRRTSHGRATPQSAALPHAGARVVLYPLAELAPELTLADGRELTHLLSECPFTGLERLPASA
ncbi:hypothetical protein CU663_32525 [Pseudomonas syringae pv. actinidifoliorum]|nr:hypothetical protein [Pseudomonas syringae pv. actinidifoliorum]